MKKLFIILLILLLTILCACGQAVPREKTSATEEIAVTEETTTTTITEETSEMPTTMIVLSMVELKPNEIVAYSDILREYHDDLTKGYSFVQHYAFYDIVGDGTNFLLLSGEDTIGKSVFDSVYTIKNGVVVRQEQFPSPALGHDPTSSLFENGTIRTEFYDGARRTSYYRFEEGALKFQIGIVIETQTEYFRVDTVDGGWEPITKEEYDRLKAEMEGDGQEVELDWRPLAEFGG